jgi:uncharacterized damage-inducible protein DinB
VGLSGGKINRLKRWVISQESSMLARYRMFAGYNAWCNGRLYGAAAQVSDADYRVDRGAFFKSLHGTLNHLLVGDRIWMRRFTGQGEVSPSLDAILYDNFAQLRAARRTEDERISNYIGTLSGDDLAKTIQYRTVVNPQNIEQMLAPALDHFFNHQTHHRGQAHALLSAIMGNELTPSFDLIIYQRQTGIARENPTN